jgi:PAS domain S-box-containing protein
MILKIKFSFLRWLTLSQLAAYLLGLVLIGGNLYFATQSVTGIYQSHRDLERSHRESLSLSKILASVQDLETGFRGFLLSGNQVFLDPYHKARRELPVLLEDLKDQLVQTELETQLFKSIDDLQQVMRLRIIWREHNVMTDNEVKDVVFETKEIMDNIRSIIETLEAPRAAFLTSQKNSVYRTVRQSYFTLELASVVNFLLLTMLFYLLWRDSHFKARSREALALNEARKNNILSASPDGIMTLNEAGEIIDWNPACERIFGCTLEQMQAGQRSVFAFDQSLATLFSSEARTYDDVFSRYGGEPFSARASLRTIQVGATRWFTLYIEDITEKKLAQQHLEQAREKAEAASLAKSMFLANMSHELRTPLNVILGYTELLEEGNLPTSQWKKNLQQIAASGRHLYDMINDILDLSKIEAGKMSLHAEVFEVIHLVRELYQVALPLVRKNNNAFKIDCASDLGCLTTDRTKLYQCLLNLISNAAKFTRDGEVRLDCFLKDSEIIFRVTDTGIGISQEQQDKLFQPFAQADISTTKKYGGTGLGLVLTAQLVALMQGRIEMTSQLEKGSQFSLALPLDDTLS